MSSGATPMKVRGLDYIRRGLRENKEDERLMIVFRRLYSGLQRVIQRDTL